MTHTFWFELLSGPPGRLDAILRYNSELRDYRIETVFRDAITAALRAYGGVWETKCESISKNSTIGAWEVRKNFEEVKRG